VVRDIFRWVGVERWTLEAVRRRLPTAGVPTRTGKGRWSHQTIWDLVQNPAYQGEAAFGRTRSGPRAPRWRAPRGRPAQSRRGSSPHAAPSTAWITIPVPALVDAAVFDAAQPQLQDNRLHARIALKGSRSLRQGLIVCARCGSAYYGRTNDARNASYRCSASDAYRWGGTRLCGNAEIRRDVVDQAVWQEVCQVLQEPRRLADAYRRRLLSVPSPAEREQVETQLRKLQRGIARLIDSYAEGLVEKAEFEPRVLRLRERVQQLEAEAQRFQDEAEVERELRVLVGRVEQFATQVHLGLQQADWPARRESIRTVVKRVEMDEHQVRVVFRLSPSVPSHAFEGAPHDLQQCGERVLATRL
jgi:site-specific DNA recombinase